ncbi:MAG TPA: response regulator [Steroidobacteraceae bacterium]|nr:response regulator [Steroidobacteraceae bacterium]
MRSPGPAHLLVVEDDSETSDLLCRYLETHGFRASTARSGAAMRRLLRETRVDLMILDLMLPGEDGLDLCRQVRGASHVPIIMLTALSDPVDRIVGIDAGADDYVCKPFSPRELLARIRSVLRRSAHAPRDPQHAEVSGYRFGPWRLDVASRTLTHADGASKVLTAGEFRLLSLLLAHPTRLLSRADLLRHLRLRSRDTRDPGIDGRISRLRRLLREDARSPQIIKTVHGEGYVLGVEVVTD